MTNLFDSPTRRAAITPPRDEVTQNVAEEDIVDAEDLDPAELEVTRETLLLDGDTRRASPELVERYLKNGESDPLERSDPDPADELAFDRELPLPQAEMPARIVDTSAASEPSLDDLLDDALQKCMSRNVAEAMQRALEPPLVEPTQTIRPRAERRRTRLLWGALAVVGGTALGVGIALVLLRFLG